MTALAERKNAFAAARSRCVLSITSGAITIDRAIQISRLAVDLDVGLVNIPAASDAAVPTSAKVVRQHRRQLMPPTPAPPRD